MADRSSDKKNIPPHQGIHVLHAFQSSVYIGLGMLRSIGHTLDDFPKGLEMIERKKHDLIKTMLRCFKENQTNLALNRANMLKENGIDWEELDVIIRNAKKIIDQNR